MTIDFRFTSRAEASGGYAVPLREAGMALEAPPRTRVKARPLVLFVGFVVTLSLVGRLALWWLTRALDASATVDFLMDDAYYYLQLAYNMGLHGRSTFDGVTETNGYQPLWMALIAGMQLLFQFDKKGLFVALQGLVTLTLMLPLLYCLVRRRDAFFLSMAAGLVGAYATYAGVFSCGMETALLSPVMVAMLVSARAGLTSSAPRMSLLFAILVMIRLDAAVILICYAAPLAYHWYTAEGARTAFFRLVKFAMPAVLTVSVYMLVNWSIYGEATPISGLAKRLGAPLLSNWGILHYYVLHGLPALMSVMLLLVIELVWTKFEGGRFLYGALAVLTASLVLHYVFFAALTGWIPWPWYFYLFGLIMVVVVARTVDIAFMRAPHTRWAKPFQRARLIALLAAAFPTVLCSAYVTVLLGNQALDNQRRGGVPSGSFNRRNVADARGYHTLKAPLTVAIGDRAAGLGYWAPDNVQVFPLEGLVSNKAYLNARKRGEGVGWIRDNIAPRYLIIDRETLDLVRLGDEERYVVIEPIQGRVVLDHMLIYCFPKDAVVSRVEGRDDQPSAIAAPAVRTTFDMQRAEACSGAFADHVRRVVFSPESLRRTGVGAEYQPEMGGDVNVAFERFDRRLAVRMRTLLGGVQ